MRALERSERWARNVSFVGRTIDKNWKKAGHKEHHVNLLVGIILEYRFQNPIAVCTPSQSVTEGNDGGQARRLYGQRPSLDFVR